MKAARIKKSEHGNADQDLVIILKKHCLAITKPRIKILALFHESENALENSLIEKKTQYRLDRITVYRTLQAFLKKGIIHTVPTYDSFVRYALCKATFDEHGHHDNHMHFTCEKCKKTICLDKTEFSISHLPKDFVAHKVDALLSGICATCKITK